MQVTRFSIEPNAIPIKNAVSGVGVLLDFKDYQACANGVNSTARQKHNVPRFDRDAVEAIGNFAGLDFLLEWVACDAAFQSDIQFRAGFRIGDVPHLGLGFAAELSGFVSGRMDLE